MQRTRAYGISTYTDTCSKVVLIPLANAAQDVGGGVTETAPGGALRSPPPSAPAAALPGRPRGHTLPICALRAFIAPRAQCARSDIYCTLCTLCILCAQCALCTLKPFFFNSTPQCTHYQYVHFVHSSHTVHNVHLQTYIAPCALCASYAPNAPSAL